MKRKSFAEICRPGACPWLADELRQSPLDRIYPVLPEGEYIGDLIDNGFVGPDNGYTVARLLYRGPIGEQVEWNFLHEISLADTEKARSYRNLAVRILGLESIAQLESRLYPNLYIRCWHKLSIWTSPHGQEYNRVDVFKRVPVDNVSEGLLF